MEDPEIQECSSHRNNNVSTLFGVHVHYEKLQNKKIKLERPSDTACKTEINRATERGGEPLSENETR